MAKGNFDACLKEVLLHEGGYVNHPNLAANDKFRYGLSWLAQIKSPMQSILHFSKKVRHFIVKSRNLTTGVINAPLMGA